VTDLDERWRYEQERRRVFVLRSRAEFEVVEDIPASPSVVWDHVTSPRKRIQWQGNVDRVDQENQGGRQGVGTTEKSLPAFQTRMDLLDEICTQEGRDPRSLRRCYFAGWADEPIFASTEVTADLVGRYIDAGATDFTFYLHNPAADPILDDLLTSHRMATRAQLENVAVEVLPQFRA
jgi:uncharacterized protein YndB with AHSA1/START domain